eukprot:GHVS01040880.1.p1 GENE.GHVS01040880.1~~GHVS01040880.1.p1  ORF type:complete len:1808 (-),score=259.44 GHVS01040880.1:156-5579(-)
MRIAHQLYTSTQVYIHTTFSHCSGREMERAAQRLTQSIGYRGAGTVEYLYHPKDDKFFFLELNPRLQVEHPVTEGVTGANLPAMQLQVSMGIPMHRIPDIRRMFGKTDLAGDSKINFLEEDYEPIKKHVLAARITAENPDEGFKPTSGVIDRLEFQSTPDVWGYFSVGAKGGIHEFADSQFGHLFASGKTREDARKALVIALKRVDVRGDIRTAVEFLGGLLETTAFKENTIDTSWLDGILKDQAAKKGGVDGIGERSRNIVLSAILSRALDHIKGQQAAALDQLHRGNVLVREVQSLNTCLQELTYQNVKYESTVTRISPELFTIEIANQPSIEVRLRVQADGSIAAQWLGRTHRFNSREEPMGVRVTLDGSTVLIPTVYNPSELRCDVNGKIVRYLIEDGKEVQKGQPYMEVEAMKMIMALKSTESGVLSHNQAAGSIISAGDLVGTLKLKDPSRVTQIVRFTGELPGVATAEKEPLSDTEMESRLQLQMLGYSHPTTWMLQQLMAGPLGKDKDRATQLITNLLSEYVRVESLFGSGRPRDDVIQDLVKQNKKDMQKVLDIKMAHRQLNKRTELANLLLRTLQSFPSRFGDWTMTPEVEEVLRAVSMLQSNMHSYYGSVALEAARILRQCRVAPFGQRCLELKKQLQAIGERGNLEDELSRLSQDDGLSAGVDLLTYSFTDKEVQDAALEVYIRRVYRGHVVQNVKIERHSSGYPVVHWQFRQRDLPARDAPLRHGSMAVVPDMQTMREHFPAYLQLLPQQQQDDGGGGGAREVNTFHVAIANPLQEEEGSIIAEAQSTCQEYRQQLRAAGIRMFSLLVPDPPKSPRYFTFMSRDEFAENRLRRDMRPTFPALMELERLQENFELDRLPAVNPNSQVYLGIQKQHKQKGRSKGDRPQTIFVRSINHDAAVLETEHAHRAFTDLLDELDRARVDPRVVTKTASGRLYLHVIPAMNVSVQDIVKKCDHVMTELRSMYAERLLRLNVDQIELKVHLGDGEGTDGQRVIRLAATSEGGLWLHTEAMEELPEPVTGEPKSYRSVTDGHDKATVTPYPQFDNVDLKRTAARRAGSTYAYDFLGLLEVALIQNWEDHKKELSSRHGDAYPLQAQQPIPRDFFKAEELRPSSTTGELELCGGCRIGQNTVGMLGWVITMKTPEYPEGRQIVLIANDITHQGGSFGVPEDEFYAQASAFARVRGLPRIYISCNSGARIGLYEELKSKVKVAWNNPNNPSLGFKYLYLSKEDVAETPKETYIGHTETVEGAHGRDEQRMVLDAIIGTEGKHIGVENLRGSGKIAGETSQAYEDTFTLSYVTGRSVGIGAYIVRLGQRTIQKEEGAIILTGYQALNKLLGREVYSSLDQLGGPNVMYQNGVAHLVVDNDQKGMREILRWLSYVPTNKFSPPRAVPSTDPVDREIAFTPTKTPYDPRHMFAGNYSNTGKWQSGFFDRNSFKEYLGGWGKGVVVGRARLGGLPVGVIGVETRSVEARIPADPANPESREAILSQAGQVWFPDSAYKTAQAIEDFNRGENLPLMIFANWRGFSGGTRDMYDEILKFGAKIVDGLRTYKHPVFIYIPPNGELRGGAWVVVDPTINPEQMEMYADKQARGGILEPPGICEIKFRSADQVSMMHRIDGELVELDKQLADCQIEGDASALQGLVKKREIALAPLYMQVAHAYADLHDRSGRMKAKGVIREELTWKTSRKFFYWRMKRRIEEAAIIDQLKTITPGASHAELIAALQESLPSDTNFDNDQEYSTFLESVEGRKAAGAFASSYRYKSVGRQVDQLLNTLSKDDRQTFMQEYQEHGS